MPILFENSIMININHIFSVWNHRRSLRLLLKMLKINKNKTPDVVIIPREPDNLSYGDDIDETILLVQPHELMLVVFHPMIYLELLNLCQTILTVVMSTVIYQILLQIGEKLNQHAVSNHNRCL